MKRKLLSLIFMLFVAASSIYATPRYIDSLRIAQRAGNSYIIHEVDPGETLFSLSQRYNVEIEQIKKLNPVTSEGLKVGQKLYIPIIKSNTKEKDLSAGVQYHEVKPSETLFSISQQYGVTTESIKKWNDLKSNNIGIGDKLIIKSSGNSSQTTTRRDPVDTSGRKVHVVQSSETLYSISKMYDIQPGDIKRWNNLQSNTISIGQKLIVSAKNSEANYTEELKEAEEESSSMLPGNTANNNRSTSDKNNENEDKSPGVNVQVSNRVDVGNTEVESTEDNYDYKKITENGFAEVIQKSNDTKKYLALHRSAPIGTIMQVRNDMNNQTVFVRVVGTIPDTDNNKKVLIKISKKAYDRLGAVDARFPVEVSYIP